MRFANLNLAVTHPNLKTRLRMHCRSVKDAAALQSESRRMIWADNTVTDQFAFRKGRAEMRTRLRHGKDADSAANEQDGSAIVSCASRRRIRQLRFGENRYKIFREYLPCRPIDPYSVLVHHFSAEMS